MRIKKHQTLIACFLFACLPKLGFAQQVAELPQSNEVTKSWEESVVEKTSLDFGDVKIGTALQPVVLFTNQTQEAFVIASISSSCGCMKPNMDAKTIEPGDSQELKIKLDTNRFRGRRSASIHVLFEKPKGREIKLAAKINIQNLIVEPEEVQFLAGDEETATRELSVRRTGSPFWKIKSIASSNPRLTATIQSSEIRNKVVLYKIQCELKPGSDKTELQNETLTLHTNDSTQLTYEIPVVIRNKQPIKVSPAILDFSNTEIGKKKIAIVRFKTAAEPKFEFNEGSGFQIMKTSKLNDRTYKLEIKQTTSDAVDTHLQIETENGENKIEVKIIAKTE